MNEAHTPSVPSPAVREFERRVNWSAVRSALFVTLLLTLGVIALWSRVAPPRTATGLPDDADTRAAAALLQNGLRPAAPDLRFRSALAGEVAGPAAAGAGFVALEKARGLLEKALSRDPLDPRRLTALAHVETALHRTNAADSRYRMALEFAPHYGEARLGLGVLLAHRSNLSPDPLERHRLRLQALAQFTAGRPEDPVYPIALLDRAVLALYAGRGVVAAECVEAYLALEPSGPWADHLRALAAGPR
jgi:tetratricopeptide (TPR) repeat protein